MAVVRSTFDWAGELYSEMFSAWLHVHFLIRTVVILFALWLIIYLAAQIFQYFLAPVFMLFFTHVIFRAWNYLFVETPQEWIYIKYHSKDLPKFSACYLRLCDKVKRNRLILSHTKYRGLVIKSRRTTTRLMVIFAVAATLWVTAFGLHFEYAVPVVAEIPPNGAYYPTTDDEDFVYDGQFTHDEHFIYYEATPPDTGESPTIPQNARLTLNETGRAGARLRDGPGIDGRTVIEILWDDAVLFFLNEQVPDEHVAGLYWLRVESPDGTVGYISSWLIQISN